MDIKKVLKEFMVSHFLKGDVTKTISDSASFLEDGIIDSVGVLEMVAFIEEKFGIHVEDEELVPENLDSIEKMVVYINKKLAAVKA